jgi:hypothetical protein
VESEKESDDTGGERALNIYQRIREVKREVDSVDKAGKHQQGFAFMKHDDVTAALSGLFVKWGIDREVSVKETTRFENILQMVVEVSWVNIDKPEDRKSVLVYTEGVNVMKRDGGENRDGLASGKALSYAVKMAELKNFCLVGDTTADNERSGSFASAPDVPPPSTEEYVKLKQLYESCSTKDELTAIRGMLSPLVQQKKLTDEQVKELSKLDADAKVRSK